MSSASPRPPPPHHPSRKMVSKRAVQATSFPHSFPAAVRPRLRCRIKESFFGQAVLDSIKGATSSGILDGAIDSEARKHVDFKGLDHVEGYLKSVAKTKSIFVTALSN
nr:uncharacterized protein LOC9266434 [Oryza sativa Japonica Group]